LRWQKQGPSTTSPSSAPARPESPRRKTARELQLDYVVLEASHRIGGRGYTEELAPGVAFDLGCHWMHSASLNPYVAIADRFGFTYRKGTFPRGLWINGRWASAADLESYGATWERYYADIMAAGRADRGISILDATERSSPWTPLLDYWSSIAECRRSRPGFDRGSLHLSRHR
jgi:monoamine oxidase